MVWNPEVVEKSQTYEITNGWNEVLKDLNIEQDDFIILKLYLPYPLPYRFITQHFTKEDCNNPVTIRFGNLHEWSIRIDKMFNGYFFTHGWNELRKDLNLALGDFLVFEKDGKLSFNLQKYGVDGMRTKGPLVDPKVRFPKPFAYEAHLEDVHQVKLKYDNGKVLKKNLRVEGAKNKKRYAVKEWKNSMKILGLTNGRKYRVKFVKKKGEVLQY
ncbi:hypothetical protein M8C21_010849 [Ambrosia artemisiifolia]|uniref:TF-B3 domain-containing protein n=1 Tax=Ambrosia artemisiifolia TaxID=4212 RepID=A0AAD5GKL0_AMBAR|nr:hypothetical protein M8C21_010849 [Ambrosia artemisiifolia]